MGPSRKGSPAASLPQPSRRSSSCTRGSLRRRGPIQTSPVTTACGTTFRRGLSNPARGASGLAVRPSLRDIFIDKGMSQVSFLGKLGLTC